MPDTLLNTPDVAFRKPLPVARLICVPLVPENNASSPSMEAPFVLVTLPAAGVAETVTVVPLSVRLMLLPAITALPHPPAALTSVPLASHSAHRLAVIVPDVATFDPVPCFDPKMLSPVCLIRCSTHRM